MEEIGSLKKVKGGGMKGQNDFFWKSGGWSLEEIVFIEKSVWPSFPFLIPKKNE